MSGRSLRRQAARHTLEAVHEVGDGNLGRIFDQQADVIVLSVHLDQLRFEIGLDVGEDVAQALDGVTIEHSAAIFRHNDQMDVHLENAVPSMPNIVCS